MQRTLADPPRASQWRIASPGLKIIRSRTSTSCKTMTGPSRSSIVPIDPGDAGRNLKKQTMIHFPENCLFYDQPEPGYTPREGVDFICSRCVILLAGATQEDLRAAYKKAIEDDLPRKAEAIKSFIGGQHEPISTFSRVIERKRSNRVSRYHKAAVGRTQTPGTSIYQGQ